MTTLVATTPSFLTHDALAELVAAQTPPCVSLFQPTHRMHQENRQDPIRFRNLVDQARTSLAQVANAADVGALLAPLDALAGDGDFWNHASAGLAVLAAPGVVRIFRLERSVRAFVVVADSFHTKPLLRHLQSVDRYQVLALSRHRALVFQGDRDALDEIAVPGVPRTMPEALGEEVTDPHLTVASYGGGGGESGAMHHGHGGRKDEIDIDTTRFFRVIDRAVLQHCSRPSGLPLILAALPEHHQPFAKISHNPSLIAHGVRIDPFGIPHDELRQLAWRAFEPRYRQRIAEVLDAFAQARAAQRATDELAQVATAAAQGRIATLFVAEDRVIAGRLAANGRIDSGDLADPAIDDVLDDLAERVAATGGEIVVLPDGDMPTRASAAALLRY